jgi:nitroimidazol reductase NimA-like FMN-containing flavoprotein (pyridoxamine 5'-phosphate oxidase superfamily)
MNIMRRKDRKVSQQETLELLDKAEYGVLSTVDKYGQPYGVPLSYVYRDNAIYFHCAVDGQKLDNIALNSKISFCVVGSTTVLPESFGTLYESAVVFGIASEVFDEERHLALVWLLEKYCTDFMEGGLHYIELKNKVTRVLKIEISQVSGKARRK